MTRGFQVGGAVEELFESTAEFYARYRRPYPPEVVAFLAEQFRLDGTGRLLDGGCGTGQVFQVLGQYFEEVVGFDVSADMLRHAALAAEACGFRHIRLIQQRGEAIDERMGEFRMAVFGASFHWMDRQRVGELVYDRLTPGGAFVVLSPNDFQSGVSEWEKEIQSIVKEFTGPERRAGRGVYQCGERHQEALRKTRFTDAFERDIPVHERRSIEEVIGYLRSTSYASRAVLGQRAEAFEDAVRDRLLRLQPGGWFEKTAIYTAIWSIR